MAVKFLDYTGLGYFWSKIKAWCNATFAAITHNQASNTINAMTSYSKPNSGSAITTSDSLNTAIGKLEAKVDAVDHSNIVHKTGTETISGEKTFTSAISINSEYAQCHFKSTAWTRNVQPTSNYADIIRVVDSSDQNLFRLYSTYTSDKTTKLELFAYDGASTANNYGVLGVAYSSSGYAYGYAPSTSENRSYGQDIVTRDWIPKDTRIVHTTGNETIAGTKTFSSSPVVPTPTVSDNSTKVATTAFVKAQGYITSSGNVATATKLANARTISLSGAVTGSVDFDGSSNSEISTVWRSCIVGHSDNNPNGQNWFKVATFTADASYLDYSITFYVEDTYYNADHGILKIHLRTNWDKILETNREHDTYLTWLTHTNYSLSSFVLVCPTTASPTLELWTYISGQYVGRRFVVLSEGNRARAATQWNLVGSVNVRESSITSTGTQVESSENTYYVNNKKQQDIAGFKTFWNDITLRDANILKYDNTSFLLLSSGHGFSRENGAHINLYGSEYSSGAGSFVLYTGHATQTTCPALFGWPSGSLQWNGQSIQTSSDERLKTSLTTVADEILDIWEDIQWGQFQFLDAVEEKGQNARLHLGFIAQHVKSVFEAHNIDICKFGILCHEIREATEFEPAFEQWMARYTEALCMEVIYQRRKNKILENRISELETQVQNMLQILESLKGA